MLMNLNASDQSSTLNEFEKITAVH